MSNNEHPPKVVPGEAVPNEGPVLQVSSGVPAGSEDQDLELSPPSADALGEIVNSLMPAGIEPDKAAEITGVIVDAVQADKELAEKPVEPEATEVAAPAEAPAEPEKPGANELAQNEMDIGDFSRSLSVAQRLADSSGSQVVDESETVVNKPYPGTERLAMCSAVTSVQQQLLANVEVIGRSARSSEDENWAAHVMSAPINHPSFEIGENTTKGGGDEFTIGMREGNVLYRSAYPRFRPADGKELQGKEAIENMMGSLGYGRIFAACMWNSGFWVSFRPAPPSAWAAINRAISNSHYEVLQRTYGLANSSRTSHAVDTIISLILPFVYTTTVKGLKLTDLPRYLTSHDKHNLIWGFITARYMNGFGIQRPCISDMSKCRHVTSETLMVSEMQRVAIGRLSESQKANIRSRQTESITIDDVLRYQREMKCAIDREVTIPTQHGTEYKLVLTVPMLDTELMVNRRYLDEVQEAVLTGVMRESSLDTRNSALNEELSLTEMRTYAPWVKEIHIGTTVTVDPKTIETMLGTISMDMVSSNRFFEEIRKFIDESNVSSLGLKPLKCPACGADHSRKTLPGFGDFIPVDIVSLFSNLARHTAAVSRARAETEE